MEYSISSDLLAKFQNASAPIQALWLVLTAIVALTAIASITLLLRLWLKQRARPAPEPELRQMGEILYGVVRAPDGRWLLYLDGTVKEVQEDRAWMARRRSKDEKSAAIGQGVDEV